jgi:hypothetical protein
MYDSLADVLQKSKIDLEVMLNEYIKKHTILWTLDFKKIFWKGALNIIGKVFACSLNRYCFNNPVDKDWENCGWMPNTNNVYCYIKDLSFPICTQVRTLDCLFFKRIDALGALNYFWDKRFKEYKIEKEK